MTEGRLPAWATPGAEVFVVGRYDPFGRRGPRRNTATIERVTPTQAILEGGRRFKVTGGDDRSMHQIGTYGTPDRIMPPTDERLAKWDAMDRLDDAGREARAASLKFSNTPSLATALDVKTTINRYILLAAEGEK